jgi:hypothetical protein
MSARERGLRVKVEGVFKAARSVCDSLGIPPLGVAFGPSMVEETGDSITRQVNLALDSILKECIRTSSVERDECLCPGVLFSLFRSREMSLRRALLRTFCGSSF